MLAKLSPIQISEEDGEKLQQQFGTQEISRVVPKSTDPGNTSQCLIFQLTKKF